MGVLMVLGWLGVVVVGVGMCGHLAAGHRALTSGADERSSREEGGSTATPCAGQQVLTALGQHLKALTQAMVTLSQHFVAGSGSTQDILELKDKFVVMETKLEAAETKLETAESQLKAIQSMKGRLAAAEAKAAGASTFVRWGRKTCPNSSQLLYSGVVGGSIWNSHGAAANALCLTRSPEFDSTPLPARYTFLYGAEYEHIPNHHNHDVPCSVCRAPHPTTLMIPSTHSCPEGWTVQYTGRLAAGIHVHPAATEFVCLDGQLENASSGYSDNNGYLFYYVAYVCGSLPCPPYVGSKVALCVVCSK